MTATVRFRVTGTAEEVLYDVEGAIRESGIGITTSRRDGTRLLAQTRASLRSWGEEITAEVDGRVLSLTSYPKAQAFDWGKSTDNIERLARALQSRGWTRE